MGVDALELAVTENPYDKDGPGVDPLLHEAFEAGRASRDAEVAALAIDNMDSAQNEGDLFKEREALRAQLTDERLGHDRNIRDLAERRDECARLKGTVHVQQNELQVLRAQLAEKEAEVERLRGAIEFVIARVSNAYGTVGKGPLLAALRQIIAPASKGEGDG